MAIEAVVFDMGGVLVHLGEDPLRAQWAARLGLDRMAFLEKVWQGIGAWREGDRTVDEVTAAVGRTVGVGDAEAIELLRDFHAHWKVDAEMVAFARRLRPRYKVGVLSNAGLAVRFAAVNVVGLGEIADLIVISAEEGIEKPDPRIYRLAADRLGVAPEACVFVDDVPANCEAARDVGMTAICCASTEQALAGLRAELGAVDEWDAQLFD